MSGKEEGYLKIHDEMGKSLNLADCFESVEKIDV